MSVITLEEKLARAGDNSGRGIVQTHMEPLGPVACTRCAELETELEADRATLDDTRAELEAYKCAVVLVSTVLRCETDEIQEVVQAADSAAGELALSRAALERIRGAVCDDVMVFEALRVLDEGLARSRGAQ